MSAISTSHKNTFEVYLTVYTLPSKSEHSENSISEVKLGMGEINASVSASWGLLIDSIGELEVLCPLSGESPEIERGE